MSTKIYNGYRFQHDTGAKPTMREVFEALHSCRDKIREIGFNQMREEMTLMATFWIDKVAAGLSLTMTENEQETIGKEKTITPAYDSWKFISKGIKEENEKAQRGFFSHYVASACVMPDMVDGKMLGMLFVENSKFTDAWESHPLIKEYGYWNNTDPLEGVSDEDWDRRRDDWDAVLLEGENSHCPADVALTFEFFSTYAWPMFDKKCVEEFMPTLDHRQNKIVEDILCKEYLEKELPANDKERRSKGFYGKYREFLKWMKSDEGIERIETGKDKLNLKMFLTYEDFLEKLPVETTE